MIMMGNFVCLVSTCYLLVALVSAEVNGDVMKSENTEVTTSGDTCRFGGSEYHVGSTWHPRLESQGAVFCVTCRCFMGGRMNCTSQECPVSCSNSESDLCCRICKETLSRKLPSPPATVPGGGFRGLTPPVPITAEGPSCLHGGRQYREGQRFSSNLTILRPTGPEQCVQCQCQAAVVMCDVVNCVRPACRQPVTTPDNCCPQCPVPPIYPTTSVTLPDYQSPFSVIFGDAGAKNKRGKGNTNSCFSGGRQYMEGEAWHPIIGPLGPMLCVLCQCRASRIECSRFRCPEPGQLPCAKPARPPGQCCDACPSPEHALGLQPPQPQSRVDLQQQGASLCLPPGADLLAYKARGPVPRSMLHQGALQNDSQAELLQFAFSQRPPGDVELHTWTLARDVIRNFQTRHLPAQNFRLLVLQDRFTTLGATTSKHVVKFGRREKKLRRRCQGNCGTKIERLLQTLQLRPVAERVACLPGETAH